MKKGSFSGLLYREYYLAKKNIIIYFFMSAGVALLGLMVLLSFHYGNLGKLMTSVLMSGYGEMTPEAEAVLENVRRSLFFGIKIYPAAMTGGFAIMGPDIAAKDTRTIWQRYEKCTPVSPLRFAGVKTAVNALSTVFTVALGLGYMFCVGIVSGEYLTYAELSIFMMFIMCFVLFSIIGQIFILFIGDRDKGMLAAMGVIIVSVWLFSNYARSLDENTDGFDILSDGSQMLMPYMPLIYICAFGVLFAAMYFIYRRREK